MEPVHHDSVFADSPDISDWKRDQLEENGAGDEA